MNSIDLDAFDARGVRVFVKYASSNGKFGIECYRKKTVKESSGDTDWKMIRVGHVGTFDTRAAANVAALQLAKDICEEFNF